MKNFLLTKTIDKWRDLYIESIDEALVKSKPFLPNNMFQNRKLKWLTGITFVSFSSFALSGFLLYWARFSIASSSIFRFHAWPQSPNDPPNSNLLFAKRFASYSSIEWVTPAAISDNWKAIKDLDECLESSVHSKPTAGNTPPANLAVTPNFSHFCSRQKEPKNFHFIGKGRRNSQVINATIIKETWEKEN